MIFIDDSGVEDNRFYEYGWSQKGKRLFADKPGFKRKRVSIIGALNEGKVKASWVIEGYCNSEIFDAYVENILVPILKPGQTIVLDNASFHNANSGLRKEESIGNRRLCGFDGIGNESRKDMNQKINRGSMASVFNF